MGCSEKKFHHTLRARLRARLAIRPGASVGATAGASTTRVGVAVAQRSRPSGSCTANLPLLVGLEGLPSPGSRRGTGQGARSCRGCVAADATRSSHRCRRGRHSSRRRGRARRRVSGGSGARPPPGSQDVPAPRWPSSRVMSPYCSETSIPKRSPSQEAAKWGTTGTRGAPRPPPSSPRPGRCSRTTYDSSSTSLWGAEITAARSDQGCALPPARPERCIDT